jgi:beta-glucosidase/6-phospho-beta-glucosidase/beta-galactosidase
MWCGGALLVASTQAIHDDYRIQFYHAYLNTACQAIERYDLNVKRIFAWTFLDNFEWCAPLHSAEMVLCAVASIVTCA